MSDRKTDGATPAKALRVLLVEDSADDAALVERELHKGGYGVKSQRVETAETMRAALEGQTWDVIISDYKLPHFSGPEALEVLRASGLDLPFILVSGTIGEEAAVVVMKAGAHDYLMKGKLTRLAAVVKRELCDAETRREFKRAEEALRESEQRFRSLYDSMSEGVALHELLYDPAGKAIDYRMLAVNPAYETITGLMADQVLGREATVAYGTAEAPYLDRYARVVASGKPAAFETRFDALGKDFRISAFSPAKDQFATVFEDISERKRAEAVLAAAKTVAEEANQAKDRLLATVSHELRTPLTPLLMRLSMLEEDSDVPASLQKSITMMRQSVEIEGRLIDGLLDLTRMTRGKLNLKPEVVDAYELLERALAISVEDSEAIAPVIRRDLKASQHRVRVDPMRLQQVCWNVIKNAVQYTPAGGTLTIESRNTANGMLELQFIDTGIGITPEFLPRVFDAFERGPTMGKVRPSGLGLGMAIAKSLMEHLGGSIHASSEGLGKGSTFTVRLPLAEAAEENSPAAPAAPTPDSAARPLRILLVEDDAATRDTIAEVLRAIGHDVNTAATVKEAIAAAESAAFDLLVSDIGLPDGSGLDVMRWFSKHRPIPGIAVSGYGTEEDMQRSLEAGFFTHITKPVPVSTLRWAIQEATGS